MSIKKHDIYFQNDIQIADFRILVYLWNRESQKSDFLVDISNIATSDIHIEKERNCPDTMTVNIEYTQFKKKLNYEGSEPQNILMPFLTEVKIQRNFETIFAGTLFHLNLKLGEVGREEVELKCCSWGEHFEKRYVSEAFHGTYPDIARGLVDAGQHEMNWFDNYAWEYEDDYFQGWSWSYTDNCKIAWENAEADEKVKYQTYKSNRTTANQQAWEDAQAVSDAAKKEYDDNQAPPRATLQHWDGGIRFLSGQYITTYSMTPHNMMGVSYTEKMTLKPMHFSFWYKADNCNNAKLRLNMAGDTDNEYGTVVATYEASISNQSDWTYYEGIVPSTQISEDIHWLRLTVLNGNIEISDLQLYTKPEQGDPYDLDIHSKGKLVSGDHKFDNQRVRHYHRQNIKDALYNLAKLSNTYGENSITHLEEPDTFEYEFDEDKMFNIYYKQGQNIADPAFSATYPGIVKSLTIERGLEDISNLNYAEATEEKTIKDKDGNEQTEKKIWASAYGSGGSMSRFGVMTDFKNFEAVHSYADLNDVGGSELNIFDEVVDVPKIQVDSNIYNMGNVFLGDTVVVNVLSDPLFSFINGSYRVYKFETDISIDSVETMKLTLTPPDKAALQIISFPKDYKYLKNDLKRLSTGANR